MESHVTGPPTLGQLRQALTAVFAGNPLFASAEQLQLRHAAHACAEPALLTQQLHALRHEAARRQRVAELRRQVAAQGEPIRFDALTQFAELEDVLAASGPWRDASNRACYRHLLEVGDPAYRVRVLGEAYLGLLEMTHRLPSKLN